MLQLKTKSKVRKHLKTIHPVETHKIFKEALSSKEVKEVLAKEKIDPSTLSFSEIKNLLKKNKEFRRTFYKKVGERYIEKYGEKVGNLTPLTAGKIISNKHLRIMEISEHFHNTPLATLNRDELDKLDKLGDRLSLKLGKPFYKLYKNYLEDPKAKEHINNVIKDIVRKDPSLKSLNGVDPEVIMRSTALYKYAKGTLYTKKTLLKEGLKHSMTYTGEALAKGAWSLSMFGISTISNIIIQGIPQLREVHYMTHHMLMNSMYSLPSASGFNSQYMYQHYMRRQMEEAQQRQNPAYAM